MVTNEEIKITEFYQFLDYRGDFLSIVSDCVNFYERIYLIYLIYFH